MMIGWIAAAALAVMSLLLARGLNAPDQHAHGEANRRARSPLRFGPGMSLVRIARRIGGADTPVAAVAAVSLGFLALGGALSMLVR
ncbi:MAG: hypothetical protein R3C52_14535 [Hyphomonadaceae bacterium]